ncbi:hypothetical protein BDL97_11G106700 [Sphagnum fallax]|nr:hypothetical protein BDL97_11G106700 [Sphagnum fallax]KAH8948702.1 hypothetical protein BDL97_11G106700 [Sphagnum fallax]
MLWRAERRDKNTAACKLLCSCKLSSPSSRAFRRELHCGQSRRSSSNGNARTGWSYAIFWKLNRRSRMLLTWKHGYYDFPKAGAVSGSELHFANNGSREWSH